MSKFAERAAVEISCLVDKSIREAGYRDVDSDNLADAGLGDADIAAIIDSKLDVEKMALALVAAEDKVINYDTDGRAVIDYKEAVAAIWSYLEGVE